MRILSFAAVAAVVATLAAPASASTYLLNFTRTGQGGYAPTGPNAANLLLDVANSANAAGGFDVLSILGGSVDGDTIVGLAPDANPSHPYADVSADGWFIFDNNLFLSNPHVSNPGLLFVSATQEYNLFSNGPSAYELLKATPHVGYTGDSIGALEVSSAPEPGAWALLLVGLGGLGAGLRANRRREGQPVAA
jgi:hypothetical protein